MSVRNEDRRREAPLKVRHAMTTTNWNGLRLHGTAWSEPMRWGTTPPDGECEIDGATLLSAADVTDWFGDELGLHDPEDARPGAARVLQWLVPAHDGEELPDFVFDWFERQYGEDMLTALGRKAVRA